MQGIAEAQATGVASYTHLYTAHPDKHMHALGVEHEEVGAVVRGIDAELARLWREVRDVMLCCWMDRGTGRRRPAANPRGWKVRKDAVIESAVCSRPVLRARCA